MPASQGHQELLMLCLSITPALSTDLYLLDVYGCVFAETPSFHTAGEYINEFIRNCCNLYTYCSTSPHPDIT